MAHSIDRITFQNNTTPSTRAESSLYNVAEQYIAIESIANANSNQRSVLILFAIVLKQGLEMKARGLVFS